MTDDPLEWLKSRPKVPWPKSSWPEIVKQQEQIKKTEYMADTMGKFSDMEIKNDAYTHSYRKWLLHHAQFFNFDLETFFKTGSFWIRAGGMQIKEEKG